MAGSFNDEHRIKVGNRRAYRRLVSEINVTPFVDVMLVLLVIFMVTAPLLTVGVEVNIEKQMNMLEKNYTFLATVGATAPFIGLFGTVWGIMNSFQSIAISRNTSLAIVAPGIAEALFATALGLLAAIPAVVAYNKFNSDSKKYSSRIENFSKRFISII